MSLMNEIKEAQSIALTNEFKKTELHLIFIVFLDKFG